MTGVQDQLAIGEAHVERIAPRHGEVALRDRLQLHRRLLLDREGIALTDGLRDSLPPCSETRTLTESLNTYSP